MYFFNRLINIEGTAVNEAVLLHPDTIEYMAGLPEERGPSRPRIFGHTRELNLMMMQIEVATGKPMKRPLIPGFELRTQRTIAKTKSAVEMAQERSRRRKAKSLKGS